METRGLSVPNGIEQGTCHSKTEIKENQWLRTASKRHNRSLIVVSFGHSFEWESRRRNLTLREKYQSDYHFSAGKPPINNLAQLWLNVTCGGSFDEVGNTGDFCPQSDLHRAIRDPLLLLLLGTL